MVVKTVNGIDSGTKCRSLYRQIIFTAAAENGDIRLQCFQPCIDIGDLAESAVKRLCNIKDSGNWVPGMGGAFDVLDSFIFNGIIFYILLNW